jgi:hypothetical protein
MGVNPNKKLTTLKGEIGAKRTAKTKDTGFLTTAA